MAEGEAYHQLGNITVLLGDLDKALEYQKRCVCVCVRTCVCMCVLCMFVLRCVLCVCYSI